MPFAQQTVACRWGGVFVCFYMQLHLRRMTHHDCFFMSLNLQDIGRIANLARLELDEAHAQSMLARLNGFFDIVEQMKAVDTTGVEPLAHPTAVIDQVALRLRDDVVSEPNQREANQKSAPAVERGLFLVPKVIE